MTLKWIFQELFFKWTFKWISHDHDITFILISHYLQMNLTWPLHYLQMNLIDFEMILPWPWHGLQMNIPGPFFKLQMNLSWTWHNHQMNLPCPLFDLQMNLLWPFNMISNESSIISALLLNELPVTLTLPSVKTSHDLGMTFYTYLRWPSNDLQLLWYDLVMTFKGTYHDHQRNLSWPSKELQMTFKWYSTELTIKSHDLA